MSPINEGQGVKENAWNYKTWVENLIYPIAYGEDSM